jgi:hypothetical protein
MATAIEGDGREMRGMRVLQVGLPFRSSVGLLPRNSNWRTDTSRRTFAWCSAIALIVTVGLVLPAGAARPRSGAWSGETAQNRAIAFEVTSGQRRVRELRVAVRARCRRGPSIVATASLAGPFPVGGGGFRIRGGDLQVRGEFKKKGRAEGMLRWEGRSYNSTWRSRRCDSGRVRWSAGTRAPD